MTKSQNLRICGVLKSSSPTS